MAQGSGLQSPANTSCKDGTYSLNAVLSNGDGTKTFEVIHNDGAGNIASASRSVIKDNQAPNLTIISPLSMAVTQSESLNVTGLCETGFEVLAQGSGLKSSVSAACGQGYALVVSLTDGAGDKLFEVVQTDGVGNTSRVTRTVKREVASVDPTPPPPPLANSEPLVFNRDQSVVINIDLPAPILSATQLEATITRIESKYPLQANSLLLGKYEVGAIFSMDLGAGSSKAQLQIPTRNQRIMGPITIDLNLKLKNQSFSIDKTIRIMPLDADPSALVSIPINEGKIVTDASGFTGWQRPDLEASVRDQKGLFRKIVRNFDVSQSKYVYDLSTVVQSPSGFFPVEGNLIDRIRVFSDNSYIARVRNENAILVEEKGVLTFSMKESQDCSVDEPGLLKCLSSQKDKLHILSLDKTSAVSGILDPKIGIISSVGGGSFGCILVNENGEFFIDTSLKTLYRYEICKTFEKVIAMPKVQAVHGGLYLFSGIDYNNNFFLFNSFSKSLLSDFPNVVLDSKPMRSWGVQNSAFVLSEKGTVYMFSWSESGRPQRPLEYFRAERSLQKLDYTDADFYNALSPDGDFVNVYDLKYEKILEYFPK